MAAVIGFGSALAAIVITPALQHYFWRRQRLSEFRVDAVKRVAELTAIFTERLHDWKESGLRWTPKIRQLAKVNPAP